MADLLPTSDLPSVQAFRSSTSGPPLNVGEQDEQDEKDEHVLIAMKVAPQAPGI